MAAVIDNLPKAIIFDWDNTLVDSWPSIGESMNAVLKAFGRPEWSPEEIRTRTNRALRDSFPEWFGDEWERARDIYRERYQAIHLKLLKPLPAAAALLDRLRELNIPLFVVSNKIGRLLRLEADTLDWSKYFTALMGSLDAPHDKPQRDAVDAALAKGNLTADDAAIWFVGDTPVDMQCAKNSGCTPIMVFNAVEAEKLGIKYSFSDCQALLNTFL